MTQSPQQDVELIKTIAENWSAPKLTKREADHFQQALRHKLTSSQTKSSPMLGWAFAFAALICAMGWSAFSQWSAPSSTQPPTPWVNLSDETISEIWAPEQEGLDDSLPDDYVILSQLIDERS